MTAVEILKQEWIRTLLVAAVSAIAAYGWKVWSEGGANDYAATGPGFPPTGFGSCGSAVNKLGLNVTDNQFAALVSFTFNLGGGNLNKLMKNGLAAVPDRTLLFDHAGGRALPA